MGSGHFLVAAVDEITRWIIDLLEENPDAPLVLEIEEYRMEIIEEQRKRGIFSRGVSFVIHYQTTLT